MRPARFQCVDFTVVHKGLEYGESLPVQMPGTLDPENGGGGVGLYVSDCGYARRFFQDPIQATELPELFLEGICQFKEVAHIVRSIVERFGLEWAMSPVGALQFLVFGYGYAEGRFEDRGESEPIHTCEGGGDAGVEEGSDAEAPVAVEAADVVVAGVQNDLDVLVGEYIAEGSQVIEGKGVNEEYLAGGYGNLDQADALRVAKEAVRFQVEGDTGLLSQSLDDADEAGLVLYEFVI